ncbi:hypothetical protein H7R52_02625 [Weissella confusa]|uniref:Uncharacterized protein n=1 Tax=Weissella confusa TaxID=1583 RepID=A0A923NEJ7_WEICO|nr:hypothetical protein [Weissella confusa]
MLASKQASKKSSTSVDNRVVEIDITNGDVYIMPGTQTVAKNAETVKAIVKQDDGNYIITKSDGTKLKVSNTSLAAFYGIFYLRVKWERYISMAKKKKSTAGKWVKRIAALFMLFLMLFGVFWAARSAFVQNEPSLCERTRSNWYVA